MLTWYVLDSSGDSPRPDGPFPFEHLAKLAASGAMNVSSMVARAGSDRWVAAGDDPELAGLFRAAPPTESFAPSGAAGLAAPGFAAPIEAPYSFGNAFDLAVKTVKSQWGPLVLAGLVTLAAYTVIGAPQWIMQAAGEASRDDGFTMLMGLGGGCFGFVVNILIGGPLFAGIALCGANAVAGRGNVADLFLGFRRYGQVLLAYLLLMAISAGVTFVVYLSATIGFLVLAVAAGGLNSAAGVSAGIVSAVIIAVALGLIATALVFVRIIFMPAIVADPSLGSIGVMDALRLNWRATRGLGWSLLALFVVVNMLVAASVLLLCVGYVLIGLPLGIAALGSVYTMLFRRGAMAAPAI
ncbi:MAG: DUF4339 domain-containing protein [Phycisphaerales bacterium]